MKYTELWFHIRTIWSIVFIVLLGVPVLAVTGYCLVSGIRNGKKHKMLEKHGFKKYMHAPRNGYRGPIYGMRNECASILDKEIENKQYKELEQQAIKQEQRALEVKTWNTWEAQEAIERDAE